MFNPSSGIAFPSLIGVVDVSALHSAKLERTKSCRVEEVEVEPRVSEATVPKHSPLRPSRERLRPPSKNSPSRNSLLPFLSSNAHGDFVVFVLTIAQNSSPSPELAQLASVEVARILRFESPQSPFLLPVVFVQVGSHL